MKTRLIIDSKPNANGEYAIRINVTNCNEQTKISTGQSCAKENFIGEYDPKTGDFIAVSLKELGAKEKNEKIRSLLLRINTSIAELTAIGGLNGISPVDFKKYVLGEKLKRIDNKKVKTYAEVHEEFTRSIKNVRNRQIYDYAMMRINKYTSILKLKITDIDVAWLNQFQHWCSSTGRGCGGASQAIRCIRSVLSYACSCRYMKLDDYPFGKGRFLIKEKQPKKTVLTFEQLNAILSLQTTSGTIRETAIDMVRWMLSTGAMNTADIFAYEPEDNSKYGTLHMADGHLEFVRVKTRSKNMYPVLLKITPRMQEIMDKYKGKNEIFRFKEEYGNSKYRIWYSRLRKELERVGYLLNIDDLTFNTIRHTWSTYSQRKGVGVNSFASEMTMGHVPQGVGPKYYCVYDWENTYDAQDAVENYIHENVPAY